MLTYDQQIDALLNSFPNRVQNIVEAALGTKDAPGLVIKKDLYFSRRRWQATVTGTTTKTYTIAAGTTGTFFAYGINDDLSNAGLPTGNLATKADTNIANKNRTNGAELFVMTGFGFALHPLTDPNVAAYVMGDCWVQAGTNIDGQPYNWGPPMFWPGAAGLNGAGLSTVSEANLRDAFAVIPGFVTNGMPLPTAYRDFGLDYIVWAPDSQPDCQFSATLTVPRAISWTMSDRAASAGTVAAETAPSSGSKGTFIEMFGVAFGWQIAKRGSNR